MSAIEEELSHSAMSGETEAAAAAAAAATPRCAALRCCARRHHAHVLPPSPPHTAPPPHTGTHTAPGVGIPPCPRIQELPLSQSMGAHASERASSAQTKERSGIPRPSPATPYGLVQSPPLAPPASYTRAALSLTGSMYAISGPHCRPQRRAWGSRRRGGPHAGAADAAIALPCPRPRPWWARRPPD